MSVGPSYTKLPMRCVCGDERRAALDAAPTDRSLEFIVSELAAGHGYEVTIDADQWFSVKATKESYVPGTHHPPEFELTDTIYVECDRIIDGVWAILDHLGPHEDFH